MDARHVAERVGRVAVVVASAIPLLAYTWIAVRRMGSPMELEWMEGGVVDHVRRAADGRNLYPEPSLEFIPYIYTPLYYYVAAPVAAVLGEGFLPLRLVSFASSLVAFASVGVLVARERGDRVAGLVAAGVFAACFAIGGAWFDLARVDSLFLALTFAGLAVARHGDGVRSAVVAGVLLGLAFLTKQQALVPAAAPLLFLLVTQRRRAVAYGASVAAVVVGSTVAFELLSDGWYLRYVLELPRGHEVIDEVRRTFWTVDLRPLVLGVALGAVGLGIGIAARRELTGPLVLFHLPVAAALVASSYASRLHSGGYDNVLLPAFGAVAVLAGLGWSELDRRPAPLLRGAAAIAVIAQLLALAYDPRDHIPRPSEERRARVLVDQLRELPGPVLMTGHGWYLADAGLPSGAQGAAIADVLRGHVGTTSQDLARELRDRIAERRWGSIVVDSTEGYSYLPPKLRECYRPVGPLFDDGRPLLPVTGTLTGPATVWAPKGGGAC